MTPTFAAPPIARPYQLYIASIEGAPPETVDPAWCYDTASAEIIFNVYDTLLTFDGEHMERYLPSIATSWTVTEISETSSEGVDWYYRYNFTIRTGVEFHNGNPLTPSDVEYSIERGMIQDRSGGPQWMFYEPLLYSWGSEAWDIGNYSAVGPDAEHVGLMIDQAVESNGEAVWFNIGFPGVYAPFLQILCQSWSSIMDQEWTSSNGRPDWNGTWPDHIGWLKYHNPDLSPLDDPTPLMMGSGPFEFDILDYTAQYWSLLRFVDYWRGWPADFPELSGSAPEGYVDELRETWAFTWPVRSTMFLAGDVDFCAVPRSYIPDVEGQDGIRLIWPLPALSCDAIFFQFAIDPATPYGPILAAGVFDETGIPSDFFGNPTWGIHVRKGFAFAFDYDRQLSEAYLNEASHPATAIIATLPYHDPTITGYTYNPAQAMAEFQSVPGLWDAGFTITILYNTGNIPRQVAAEILRDELQALNPKFHVNIANVDWNSYLRAAIRKQLPNFIIGWLADYPDAHNFAQPFYYTYGTFSYWQTYSNPTMDALIDAGIAAAEEDRAAIYSDIQQLAVDDCPSTTILLPIGRHWERDWVVGWYYNPVYPGLYAYNIWKWYYVEEALQSTAAQPYSYLLPVDINYDGKVDMKDIGVTAKGFGANYGPPIHPRWVFRCDFNNDRKIDMKDIGRAAKQFGKTSPVWVPPP
jgi:peptide/nickel transport system substrate-binding protein